MCAIVDANVASQVFGVSKQPAGAKFFAWINKGAGRLVTGGKLLEELDKSSRGFRQWAQEAVRAGKMRIIDEDLVDTKTTDLQNKGLCESDDHHVIALAQLSGARLLYSNDRELQKDFKTKSLVGNPQGKVYSTIESSDFKDSHQRLLRRRDLCQA